MSARTQRKSPTQSPRSPRALAEKAATEWLEYVVTDRLGLGWRCESEFDGDASFEAVFEALKREHIAQHGPIKPDQDSVEIDLGIEAGYLIGVQVGLRLREPGGAR